MRLKTLLQVPSHVVMIAFAAIFVSYVDLLFEARGQWPIPVLAVNVFLFVLGALTFGTWIQVAASSRKRAEVFALYRSNISVLIPLVMIVVFSFLSAYRRTSYLDAGPRYVMYPAYSATIVALSMLLPLPEHRYRSFRWYLLVSFLAFALTVLVDVVHPGTFSILPDRAAGFARNPNAAGFFLVALLSALISFERIRGIDLAVVTLAMTSVLATLSRGGIILLSFLLICYAGSVVRHRRGNKIGAVFGRGAALVLVGASTLGAVTLAMSQRMFASSSESGLEVFIRRWRVAGSRESRVRLVHDSWALIRENPLFGYGSGYTYTMPQGPHNMYLSRWLDNGLLGVVAFVWLLAAMAFLFRKRGYTPGLVFTGVVALQSFFTHNLLEERLFLVMVGVLLTLSYRDAIERQTVTEEAPVEYQPARSIAYRRAALRPRAARRATDVTARET